MGEYIVRATPELSEHLKRQWDSAIHQREIVCCCGLLRALEMAYRCLYCGAWFCGPCAEVHFGKTLKQWIAEKSAKGISP